MENISIDFTMPIENSDAPENSASPEITTDLDMSASDERQSRSMEYRGPYRYHPTPNTNIIPPNHRPNRKQFSVARPFEYILQGTPPTAFQLPNNTIESHSVSFPQIPKDYVGNVKSIQDILQKVNADGEGFSIPSLAGDQKIRFEGTYRHRKDNSFANIFDKSKKQHYSGTYVLPSASSQMPTSDKPHKTDPFYLYKPQTPSDINLLATHEFRFAPSIRYSTPKPVVSSNVGHYPDGSLFYPYIKGQDVSSLYQQIIAANIAHSLKTHKDESRRSESNQKPFSLMLDVYPMTDDEPSTTARPYTKYRGPFLVPSSNVYPPNLAAAAAVNSHPMHSSHLDNPGYFQNLHFPQLPSTKQRLLEAQHFYNQMYLNKLQKTKNTFNPYYHQPVAAATSADGNTPSQITVHLNLFPKNKNRAHSKMRNVEILSRTEEPFTSAEALPPISGEVKVADNPVAPDVSTDIRSDEKTLMVKPSENALKKMLKMEMVPVANSTVQQLLEIERTSGLGDHCETTECRNENYRFYNDFQSTTTATAATLELSTIHERTYDIEDGGQQYSEHINQYDQGVAEDHVRLSTSIPTIIPIEPRSFTVD